MSDHVIEEKLVTEAELTALGSDARVEIIDGEIVEMSPVGGLHHFITGNAYDVLRPFVKAHNLGYVFMDGLLYLLHQLNQGIKGALVPDVSFVRKEDVPADWNIEKPFPGALTLAIEVMSPDDAVEDVLKKVRQYLDAGTLQVWVIYPRQREVHQYKRGLAQVRTYTGDDRMEVDDLFPGLVLTLADLFDVPELG